MSTMPPTGRLDPSIEPRDQIHHIDKISLDMDCGVTVDAWGLVSSLPESTVASGATSCTGSAYIHFNGFSSDRLAMNTQLYPLACVELER